MTRGDGPFNMPDLYRAGFRLGRRGGDRCPEHPAQTCPAAAQLTTEQGTSSLRRTRKEGVSSKGSMTADAVKTICHMRTASSPVCAAAARSAFFKDDMLRHPIMPTARHAVEPGQSGGGEALPRAAPTRPHGHSTRWNAGRLC